MNTTNSNSNPNLDPSLRSLESALDRLGAAERHAAPESLDDSVLRAVRRARADGDRDHSDVPSIIGRIFGPRPALRLAAAVAIVATGALLATVAMRSSTTSATQFASVEAEFDAFLTPSTTTTSTTNPVLGDALVDVKASIAAAELSLDDFWTIPDDSSDPLATELESTL